MLVIVILLVFGDSVFRGPFLTVRLMDVQCLHMQPRAIAFGAYWYFFFQGDLCRD